MIQLRLNSLGGPETQRKFASLLRQYLTERSAELSDTSRRRLQQGWVLRILDSKLEQDALIIMECPKMHDFLNDAEKRHFELILTALHKRQIQFTVDSHLVRGLDYYGGLVFEFETIESEAFGRHTLLGGGRYDGLSKALGGSYSLPSIGWALGVDRCASLIPAASQKRLGILIFSMEGADDASASLAAAFRKKQIATVVAYSAELKDLKKLISSTMATHCIFIGSKELQGGYATIKDTASFEQRNVSLAELPDLFL